MKFIQLAILSLGLISSAFASDNSNAASEPTDPAHQERIYYAGLGSSVEQSSRIEYTEDGAVIHVTSKIVLKARPMSKKEKGLRIEWINTLPLGEDETSDESPRFKMIEKILNRTSPANILNQSKQALSNSFSEWDSPMKFEALFLDQNHPRDDG